MVAGFAYFEAALDFDEPGRTGLGDGNGIGGLSRGLAGLAAGSLPAGVLAKAGVGDMDGHIAAADDLVRVEIAGASHS